VHEAVKELVQYDIAGIWLDGYGVTSAHPELFRLQELYDTIHEAAPHLIVANKHGPTGTEDYFDTEHGLNPPGMDPNYDRNAAKGKKLEVCTSMAGGWGWHAEKHFLPGERHCIPADRIYEHLKMLNTFGANLLLNLGPRWDGSIEPEQVRALLEVGERIRAGGYPVAEGEELAKMIARQQERMDIGILSKLRAAECREQKSIMLRLMKSRHTSPEYKAAHAEMRRLKDVDDPDSKKLIDQWYAEHPANWFVRGKQFLKPYTYDLHR
jgi:alpha-L-fucosidase